MTLDNMSFIKLSTCPLIWYGGVEGSGGKWRGVEGIEWDGRDGGGEGNPSVI